MYKLCVFAGTTEGRRLVDFLKEQDASITACAATEYGGELIEPSAGLQVLTGRMDAAEMAELFERERFDLVIDATHPYAAAVTENIMTACGRMKTEYLRLERGETNVPEGAVSVPDIAAAIEYLNGTAGNILLTTGSKELVEFSHLAGFEERVFARVLPVESSIAACSETGLKPSHILAMQGPFSADMNVAMIESVNAAYVVTKETCRAGGFDEKALAAKKTGATLITIGRPDPARGGLNFTDTLDVLEQRFGFRMRPKVAVIGIGPGSRHGMTAEALDAAAQAECLIGAGRMLEIARADQTVCEAFASDEIVRIVREHKDCSRFAVLFSGDVGFFSGAKKLLPKLDFCDVRIIPGVSSLSYLCAKAEASYEDTRCVSLHGRCGSIIPAVRGNRSVFALVGGENGAGKMIDELAAYGLGAARVTVGERLGYAEERIVSGTASELKGSSFDTLSAVLIENDRPESAACGLPDEAFLRNAGDKPVVPMTKSEVRAVVMSKLRLLADSVCWDVGAGTGSVSVEMALTAGKGKVYAIEKKPEAVDLLRQNISAFGLANIEVVEGSAPAACADLPAPTHVFIGGSSGNVRDIIALLLVKSPKVTIVATAISIETVAELNACMKEFDFTKTDAVCLNVARARTVGDYNLMTSQNPIYIFTMQAS